MKRGQRIYDSSKLEVLATRHDEGSSLTYQLVLSDGRFYVLEKAYYLNYSIIVWDGKSRQVAEIALNS